MVETLEVAIGLVLAYLTLSVIASAISEGISQILAMRGRSLRGAIRRLLGDSDALRKAFYDHARVRTVSARGEFASYLPPDTFVDTVIDLVIGPGGAELPAAKRGDQIAGFGWRTSDLDEPYDTPPEPAHHSGTPPTNPTPPPSLAPALVARRQLAAVVSQISDRAGDDPVALRRGLREWFDAAMERLSGSYRRWTQLVLLGIGLGLALAVDADSIAMVDRLISDPQARADAVAAAEKIAELPEAKAIDRATAIEAARPALQGPASTPGQGTVEPERVWSVTSVIGYFLTAIAISLGAPFWFDTLQGLLRIRASLRPADPSKQPAPTTATPMTKTDAATVPSMTPAAAATDLALHDAFAPANTYTDRNAWALARLSEAAYLDPAAFAKAIPPAWRSTAIHGPKEDTQAYVVRTPDATLVVFRGTESLRDATTDARVGFADSSRFRLAEIESTEPWGRQHTGFTAALEEVWTSVDTAITAAGADGPIHFCGHSLGGALAVLAAVRWATSADARRVAGVYTYGQPRCGDAAFARSLDRLLGERVYRHVNHRDAVPRLPPRALAYRHAGRCLYFDAYGRRRESPASWLQVLDAMPLSREEIPVHVRETVGDHGIAQYVRLTRALLG